MIYAFVINPSVTDDILDIVTYYKNINPELALDFLNKIEITKKYISDFPLAFQIKYKNVRMVLLEQFPYQIHYVIDDDAKQIIVLAVIHAYRNPRDYSKK